jgi:hypothetical protein
LGAAFISKITDCNDRATPSFVEQKIWMLLSVKHQQNESLNW